MSSDNGIYIGKFSKGDGFEYRVIHAQAIENCDYRFDDEPPYGKEHEAKPESEWSDETKMLQDCQRLVYYGESNSFTKSEALEEAKKLDQEFKFSEYGICEIEYSRPLPDLTVEQASKILSDWEEKKDKERAEKIAAIQKKREENTKTFWVLVPVQVSEYNGNISSGTYVNPEEIEEAEKLFERHSSKEQLLLAKARFAR